MNHFQKICSKNGLRRTPQKEKIYEILANTHSHPTAQEIHQEAKKYFLNISFATVYKNLILFEKYGFIQELDFGEGASRYDARTEDHHHIFDSKKNQVIDVYIEDNSQIPIPKELKQKDIKKISITYIL